jgi:thiol-disulfide isomerase/thioredoxin
MLTNRTAWLPLLILTLAAAGCGEQLDVQETKPQPIPSAANETGAPPAQPSAPADASRPEPGSSTAAPRPDGELVTTARLQPLMGVPATSEPKALEAPAAPASESFSAEGVTLEKVKWDEFQKRLAANPTKARYTLVDAWATWCAPCKENFHHLVEMHDKYSDKGLAVASLSFDDPTDTRAVEEAKKFLAEKKAKFPNYLLDEEPTVGFDKLEINAIPAVFLFGPDGKLVKSFTLDDPNNQFTYEDVEKTVAGLLDGKLSDASN